MHSNIVISALLLGISKFVVRGGARNEASRKEGHETTEQQASEAAVLILGCK